MMIITYAHTDEHKNCVYCMDICRGGSRGGSLGSDEPPLRDIDALKKINGVSFGDIDH